MDYLNIDFSSDHERNSNLLDGYDFETLFLEISCNLTEINEEGKHDRNDGFKTASKASQFDFLD